MSFNVDYLLLKLLAEQNKGATTKSGGVEGTERYLGVAANWQLALDTEHFLANEFCERKCCVAIFDTERGLEPVAEGITGRERERGGRGCCRGSLGCRGCFSF